MAFEARLPGTRSPVYFDTAKPPDLYFTHTRSDGILETKPYLSSFAAHPPLNPLFARSIIPISDVLETRKDPKTLEDFAEVLHMAPRLVVDDSSLFILTPKRAKAAYALAAEVIQLEITQNGMALRDISSDALNWGLLKNGNRLHSTLPLLDEKDLPALNNNEIVHLKGDLNHNYIAWPIASGKLMSPTEYPSVSQLDVIYMIFYDKALRTNFNFQTHVARHIDRGKYDGEELRGFVDPYVVVSLTE